MAADEIQENIGKLFRKISTVAAFDDFVQLCENANNNIKMIALDLPFISYQDHRPKFKSLLWKV